MRGAVTVLCWRPHHYTPDGRFTSVVAFLDGFACGRSGYGVQSLGIAHHGSEFGRFREWLLARCRSTDPGTPANRVWWSYVLTLHPDEAEALRNLPALYGEFLAQDGDGDGA